MNYWQHVQDAAGMGSSYHWVLLGTVVLALVLATLAPGARLRLRATVVLILASFLGILLCGMLLKQGADAESAGYRFLHFSSQLLFLIAVVNLAGVAIFRVILAAIRLEPAPILRDTILGLAYIAATLMLLSRHGVNLSGIVATSAVVTAVIGFSLQDTLGNVMGGMALQVERSIAVGDWVRIGDVEGLVREIRWRQTSIETRNWDTVVIPNSVLMKSQVTVLGRRFGQPRLHRMWVEFNVDFRHSPTEVIEVVEQALRSEPIPNVSTEPLPDCILSEFRESYGHYSVRYWLMNFHADVPTSSEVRARIFVALKRAGIGMSIPAQSVFMTMEGRARAARKQREEHSRRASALKKVSIFEPLTDTERLELSERLSVAPFRKGETITRQGNEANHLYMIMKGQTEVRVSAGEGDSRVVAQLGAGQVFGEMALMTGERRSATVTALTDTICYRLDREAFSDILHRRPEIAEAISHMLARRKIELDAMAQHLDADAMNRRTASAQSDLLERIRRFFTLS